MLLVRISCNILGRGISGQDLSLNCMLLWYRVDTIYRVLLIKVCFLHSIIALLLLLVLVVRNYQQKSFLGICARSECNSKLHCVSLVSLHWSRIMPKCNYCPVTALSCTQRHGFNQRCIEGCESIIFLEALSSILMEHFIVFK